MDELNRGRVYRLPPYRGLPPRDIAPDDFDAEGDRCRVRLMRECVATEMPDCDIVRSEAGKMYEQFALGNWVRKRSL